YGPTHSHAVNESAVSGCRVVNLAIPSHVDQDDAVPTRDTSLVEYDVVFRKSTDCVQASFQWIPSSRLLLDQRQAHTGKPISGADRQPRRFVLGLACPVLNSLHCKSQPAARCQYTIAASPVLFPTRHTKMAAL